MYYSAVPKRNICYLAQGCYGDMGIQTQRCQTSSLYPQEKVKV